MAGRPTKLNKKIIQTIETMIKSGAYPAIACEAAGIDRSTFYIWMKRGAKEETGLYRQFFNTIQKALAACENGLVGTIIGASEKNWTAAAWVLERRWPERWAKREAPPQEDDTETELTWETDEEAEDPVQPSTEPEAVSPEC